MERKFWCVQLGKTVLHYDTRYLNDLHEILKSHGVWMELGSKDQKVDTKEETVEHWGRSVGGWYGLKNGFKGRFGMYIQPLMEALGLVLGSRA
jgi:hypothetical protein